MTSASKVGDLFTAAGEAFAKLAELTRILQAVSAKNAAANNDDEAESGWSSRDTELLQMAVKRFGDELNVISEHIKDKTMYQIKSTFRKIPSLSNAVALNERSNLEAGTAAASAFGGSGGVHNSVGGGAFQSASGATAYPGSLIETNASTTSRAHLPGATSAATSNSFPAASTNSTGSGSGGGAAATAAASSCSSPSPFLHYPLLRKSADITLNMLNARDDSDDDERVSKSVFNSV